jgi:hypothetical protein
MAYSKAELKVMGIKLFLVSEYSELEMYQTDFTYADFRVCFTYIYCN